MTEQIKVETDDDKKSNNGFRYLIGIILEIVELRTNLANSFFVV